jgi:large subunit ribosomal protein L10
MSKIIKQMQLDSLKTTFDGVRDLVFLKVVGLGAVADNQVRLALRKKGIRMQVVKNSLARRIFGDMGIKVNAWEGATTLAWGANSIAELSKEIDDVAKKHEKFVKVKTAVADGQEVPFATALKMPTRLEALATVAGMILAPASNLAAQILGPASTVAGQVKQISEKKEEAAPAA